MIRIGRRSAFLRGLRCSCEGKETSQSTGFMRLKADGIFEGCIVYHAKKHNVESVNHKSHIDCLEGVMLEVKRFCRQTSSSFCRMCLQQFCWRETCSSSARWTSGRCGTSCEHHEHFGIFWHRTYGSTSEACESRMIQHVADTCWQ